MLFPNRDVIIDIIHLLGGRLREARRQEIFKDIA